MEPTKPPTPEAENVVTPPAEPQTLSTVLPTMVGLFLWIAGLIVVLGGIVWLVG